MSRKQKDLLPVGDLNLRPATNLQLVRHGLSLHWAILTGALRTSREFKKQHRNWRMLVLRRFLAEYGMNLLLLCLLQLLILDALGGFGGAFARPGMHAAMSLGSIALLPLLTVAQAVTDRLRKTCEVYTDEQGNVGMTVRLAALDNQGKPARWVFLNHYALPVGQRHGVRMRNSLHREAQAKGVDIACRAQNDKVADYYMTERPGAMVTAGARPYLQWQYREPVGEVVVLGKSFDPFGFSSTRDAGQLPLA